MKTIEKKFSTKKHIFVISPNDIIKFFNQGHPIIHIDNKNGDACTMLQDLFEAEVSEIYDQNGGEFDLETLENNDDVISIKYTLYDISLNDEDVPKNYTFEIVGFFIETDEFFIEEIKFFV